MKLWQGFAAFVLVSCVNVSIPTFATAQPTMERAHWYIAQLSAPQFSEREGAMKSLRELGIDSLPLLCSAIRSSDPEIRWRAAKTLEEIGISGDERSLRKVTRVMRLLGQSGVPGMSDKSFQMRRLWLEGQTQRIVDHLTQRGANVIEQPWLDDGFQNVMGRGIRINSAEVVQDVLPSETQIAAESEAPPLSDRELQVALAEILKSTEAEDEQALMEEPVAIDPAAHSPESSANVNERNIVVNGDIHVIQIGPAIDGAIAEPHGPLRLIDIGEAWRGSADDFALIAQVNNVINLSIQSQTLDQRSWQVLGQMADLTSLQLVKCDFKGNDGIRFHREHPNVNIRVTGKGFLGVMGPIDGSVECEISQVVAGNAAEQAGVLVGDVIKKIDGQTVNEFQDLIFLVASKNPGDTINISLQREGELLEVTATLRTRDGFDQ